MIRRTEARSRLEGCIDEFLDYNPYYGCLLGRVQRNEIPGGPKGPDGKGHPMGVRFNDGAYILGYDPAFIMDAKAWYIRMVIHHELWHIIARHNQRQEYIDLDDSGNPRRDFKIWMYATDCAVNSAIPEIERHPEVKEDLVHPEHFDLPGGKRAEFYFDKLKEQADEVEEQMGDAPKVAIQIGMPQDPDDEDEDRDGNMSGGDIPDDDAEEAGQDGDDGEGEAGQDDDEASGEEGDGGDEEEAGGQGEVSDEDDADEEGAGGNQEEEGEDDDKLLDAVMGEDEDDESDGGEEDEEEEGSGSGGSEPDDTSEEDGEESEGAGDDDSGEGESDEAEEDESDPRDNGSEPDDAGGEQDNSESGESDPDEEAGEDESDEEGESREYDENDVDDGGGMITDHMDWAENQDPVSRDRKDSELEQAVKEAEQKGDLDSPPTWDSEGSQDAGSGTAVDKMKEILDRRETRNVNWRFHLRLFSREVGRRSNKQEKKFKDRRYNCRPRITLKPNKTLMWLLDISGSMNEPALEMANNEMKKIDRYCNIVIVQHNRNIVRVDEYNHELPPINPGGGTHFIPPYEYYRENSHRFSGMVHFTDGRPNDNPDEPSFPVLYAYPPSHKDLGWGRSVLIEPA